MPIYSGDLIYQNGLETGSVLPFAANYRKTTESSNFGTRKLAWYTVQLEQDYGLAANWQDSNSLYYQIVRAIQQGGNIGGSDAPTEGNGQIRGGGGGGAELFYVGEPQNSASSPANHEGNWYGLKPTYYSSTFTVTAARGTGTIATLTFSDTLTTPPFNVGDPVHVQNVGAGYNCDIIDQHFVTECTTTYVKFNSAATATLIDLEDATVEADLGFDCFTFAIVDDAEPFLPEGSGFFGDTDYSGIAGDAVCYCGDGRYDFCKWPISISNAVRQVLLDNELSTNFYVWRLAANFGLTL